MKRWIVGLAALALLACQGQMNGAVVDRGDFSPVAINIDFDSLPSGTVISNQYAALGVEFSSSPITDGNNQSYYGPLASPPNVLLQTGSVIDFFFVDPVLLTAAPTTAVGADIIFRDTGTVSMLEVFDQFGTSLGSINTPLDTGIGDEVFIGFGSPVIYSARFSFDVRDNIVGIDNLIFEPTGAVIPEPASLAIWSVLGGIALAVVRYRRRKT